MTHTGALLDIPAKPEQLPSPHTPYTPRGTLHCRPGKTQQLPLHRISRTATSPPHMPQTPTGTSTVPQISTATSPLHKLHSYLSTAHAANSTRYLHCPTDLDSYLSITNAENSNVYLHCPTDLDSYLSTAQVEQVRSLHTPLHQLQQYRSSSLHRTKNIPRAVGRRQRGERQKRGPAATHRSTAGNEVEEQHGHHAPLSVHWMQVSTKTGLRLETVMGDVRVSAEDRQL